MKNLLFITLISAASSLFAQVGISSNTNYTTPAGVDLSIDGSLTVRDRIYAGGNSTTLGNPGKSGQVLVSQGANLPPRWRTLNIPNFDLVSFYLIYNNSFTDYNDPSPGIQFAGNTQVTTGSNGPYTFGTLRTDMADFQTIGGLTEKFDVFSNSNQVYITFEAVAQINTSGQTNNSVGVDFVCGIFAAREGQPLTLRSIRKATLQRASTANNPFITFTQIALADGLSSGKHDVQVACKRTANYNGYSGQSDILAIGRPAPPATNINTFISQTSLKVEVYEIPQTFINILD